jgi:hypothetical protein
VLSDTRGAGFIEYLALVGAVALFALVGFQLVGSSMSQKAHHQADRVASLDGERSPARVDDPKAASGEPAAAAISGGARANVGSAHGAGAVVEVKHDATAAVSSDAEDSSANDALSWGLPAAGVVGILIAAGALFLFFLRSRGHLHLDEQDASAGAPAPSWADSAEASANLELAAGGCGPSGDSRSR